MGRCMELLGGAWTAEIIWQLSGGPRRFGELQKDISRVSPKMLSQRLRKLEEKMVLVRKAIASSPPSAEYSLSPLGEELLPVIAAIVKVGTRLQAAENLKQSSRRGASTTRAGEPRCSAKSA
ncbi:MAG: helix-turn-helix domain-containing protein [Steroidobacteraceae bacterium]